MIVVFDSDVLIPMIIEASRSAHLFSRLDAAGHQIAVSPQIIEEVAEKLRTKASLRKWLDLSDDRIEQFLDDLPRLCVVVKGILSAPGSVPDDPDDDIIVAAGMEADADYIISENKHLLTLGNVAGIPIMNRVTFSAELDRLGVPHPASE
jgi:putative PIN family toxin of toxin-antitoxin system